MDRDTCARFSLMESRVAKLEKEVADKDAEIELLERMHERIERLERFAQYELHREMFTHG